MLKQGCLTVNYIVLFEVFLFADAVGAPQPALRLHARRLRDRVASATAFFFGRVDRLHAAPVDPDSPPGLFFLFCCGLRSLLLCAWPWRTSLRLRALPAEPCRPAAAAVLRGAPQQVPLRRQVPLVLMLLMLPALLAPRVPSTPWRCHQSPSFPPCLARHCRYVVGATCLETLRLLSRVTGPLILVRSLVY